MFEVREKSTPLLTALDWSGDTEAKVDWGYFTLSFLIKLSTYTINGRNTYSWTESRHSERALSVVVVAAAVTASWNYSNSPNVWQQRRSLELLMTSFSPTLVAHSNGLQLQQCKSRLKNPC